MPALQCRGTGQVTPTIPHASKAGSLIGAITPMQPPQDMATSWIFLILAGPFARTPTREPAFQAEIPCLASVPAPGPRWLLTYPLILIPSSDRTPFSAAMHLDRTMYGDRTGDLSPVISPPVPQHRGLSTVHRLRWHESIVTVWIGMMAVVTVRAPGIA